MSDTESDRVTAPWLELSSDVFVALHQIFGLGDTCTFSLKTPDGDPNRDELQFDNDKDNVSFMLRRIQVVRYLVKRGEWDQESSWVTWNYLAALTQFLKPLANDSTSPLAVTSDAAAFELVNKFLHASNIFLAMMTERQLLH